MGGMPVAFNLAEKLIHSHLVTGSLMPGQEIAVSIDRTLLQDVPGTLVMLDLRRWASTGANEA
jgi:aconitate hydratase